jgi:hypothetical protein
MVIPGAAVFGMDGSVVGMLTSGFTNGKDDKGECDDLSMSSYLPEGFEKYEDGADLSFVTPIQVIFDDIEAVTRCKAEVS